MRSSVDLGSFSVCSPYLLCRQGAPSFVSRLRDESLKQEITRVYQENYSVSGARKIWHQLGQEGFPVARCTIERLMAVLGIKGARRGH